VYSFRIHAERQGAPGGIAVARFMARRANDGTFPLFDTQDDATIPTPCFFGAVEHLEQRAGCRTISATREEKRREEKRREEMKTIVGSGKNADEMKKNLEAVNRP
jgi:hypothetical protein